MDILICVDENELKLLLSSLKFDIKYVENYLSKNGDKGSSVVRPINNHLKSMRALRDKLSILIP